MRIRQRAVALYFIDKLALRAGNEKDTEEAAGKQNKKIFSYVGYHQILSVVVHFGVSILNYMMKWTDKNTLSNLTFSVKTQSAITIVYQWRKQCSKI